MPRIALGIEYCGSDFHGWQKQSDCVSVQAALEQAIENIVQHPVKTICAGRTDSGVHALCMVAHFDTPTKHPERAFIFGLNHFLPRSIRIHHVKYVSDDFHARFSAQYRRYQYVILNNKTASALLHQRVLWRPVPLDVEKMQAAANHLVGQHDFTSFRDSDCQAKSPIKTVQFCKVSRQGDKVIIDIQADGFLHHMVRNIIGVLLKIGEGRQPVEWITEVINAKDRTAASMNVPADGLYFKEVGYPEQFGLNDWANTNAWFAPSK